MPDTTSIEDLEIFITEQIDKDSEELEEALRKVREHDRKTD